MVTIWYKLMGVNPRHRAKAVVRFSELRAPSEDGDGGFTPNVSTGTEDSQSSESPLFAIERSE